MRLVLALVLMGLAAPAEAQTAKPTAKPRTASSAVTTTLSLTVTDGKGAPISGVSVRVSGPVDREGATENGSLRLQGLRSGTYRLRFARDGFITLERDFTVPSGQRSMDLHVMLSAAEGKGAPAPTVAEPEPAKTGALPPPGKAVTMELPDFIERNFISGKEPQKVSSVACSGLSQTILWQIREPWANRQHADADAMLYVIGGEGSMRMDGRDSSLQAGSFVSVPRGTTYSFTRRGRNPLIVLATLTGEPCAP